MADELEHPDRQFEEAQTFARTYRFDMTDEYRALIERVEAMPQNQPGTDKSGPWRGSAADHRALRARAGSPTSKSPCKDPVARRHERAQVRRRPSAADRDSR